MPPRWIDVAEAHPAAGPSKRPNPTGARDLGKSVKPTEIPEKVKNHIRGISKKNGYTYIYIYM